MKTKKILALGLAAAMVLGSSLTVFAEETDTSGETTNESETTEGESEVKTSGESTGTGENEGHVDKHVISVTLPTIDDGATPFSYTVDPERLVAATDGSKYDVTFSEDAKKNGVYFLTSTAGTEDEYKEVNTSEVTSPADGVTYYIKNGESYDTADVSSGWTTGTTYYTKTTVQTTGTQFDSKSDELTVTSESSADVKLTVSVAATKDTGDITLVGEAPSLENGTDTAQLYLALMVGDEVTVIKAGETVSKEVTIEGVAANFETTYNDTKGEYEYTAISEDSDDFTAWKTASFYLTGVASNADAEGVSVPTLTVTWKYEDPEAAAATPTTNVWVKNDDGSISYTFSDAPTGSLTAITFNGSAKNGQIGTNVTYADGTLTINEAAVSAFISSTGTTKIVATIGGNAQTVDYTAE